MGIERIPGQQKDYLQTDSRASTAPGFRMSCQMAASQSWDLFPQNSLPSRTILWCESWCRMLISTRSRSSTIHCCKTEETCIWHFTILLDASGTFLDEALRSYGMVPTRADRCCTWCILCNRVNKPGTLDTRNHRTAERHKRNLHWFTWPITNGSCIRKKNAGSYCWKSPLQENPWQESAIYLGKTSLEQVETKWNNALWPDLQNISKLVQKIGTILPLQDNEFVGHKIPKTGRTMKSVETRPWMSLRKSQWNETRRKTSIALLQCTQCTEA